MSTPSVQPVDLTRYATAEEIADRTPVPVLSLPGELVPQRRLLGLVKPRRDDDSFWLPDTKHVYYPELDHGLRPETKGVVLHVNQGYYQGTLDFFHHNGGVGAHFEIGFVPGQVTQLVPINRKCWHGVAANSFSIGVEHAGFGRTRAEWLQDHEYEVRISAERVAWILHRYDLGRPKRHTNIFYHSDGGDAWGGHTDCPGVHFPYDVWEKYCLGAYLNHWGR